MLPIALLLAPEPFIFLSLKFACLGGTQAKNVHRHNTNNISSNVLENGLWKNVNIKYDDENISNGGNGSLN